MSWLSAARARLHLLFAPRAAESRMDGEIAFPIEMEADRLVREEHLSPDEARRRALVAFGGVTQHREVLRAGRGLAWLSGLSLDFTLAFRMLRKYPGLTVVGGLAMAFAIWVGTVSFEVVTLFVHPSLPLPDGDRIVRIEQWNLAESYSEAPAPHDFIAWREALSTVTDLGAYRDDTRNLITADGDARTVYGAEITASAFRIVPDRPLLGRALSPDDENAGAPPVAVLGYDVWRTRFSGDSNVVGRTVQLGDLHATVVGVMPEHFAFPTAHELWTPLRLQALDRAPGEGPAVQVFGRLRPGIPLETARAELAVLGQRAAGEFPATHANLQPRVSRYAHLFGEPSPVNQAIFFSIYLFALMLLVLICGNVALLLFARAATREGELIVRSALGATRSRIVLQLFAEALLLGCVAAAVGLVASDFALRTWGVTFLERNLGRLPFWYDPRLSPASVSYALGLTVLGAAIAGVLPALKITRGLGARLKQATAGGGGVQFGGVWTAVIIAQVAVTVAFPAIVFLEQRELRRIQSYEVGFSADEYLGVRLNMDATAAAGASAEEAAAARDARYGAALEQLRRRVAAEPGVAGVTFVDELPRMFHTERYVEVDLPAAAPVSTTEPHEVSTARIDPSYFEVLRTPILAGRPFDAGDVSDEPRVVIVDQAFVDNMLGGRNPIGQRIRFVERRREGEGAPAPPEPWYEIVGLVNDLGMTFMAHQHRAAGVYLPAGVANSGPLNMVVHAQGDPLTLAPRVRELAAAVDPALRIGEIHRVDKVSDALIWLLRMWLQLSLLLTAIAVLLSLAGIYAVLSYTVARRTREIGVRVALGASPRRIVAAIFRRPLTRVGLGVLAGEALIVAGALLLSKGDGGLVRLEGLSFAHFGLFAAYAAFMFGVCLLACIVPTRRALTVEPTEALRAE